jgi:uncharacterized membrane protein YbhN (UPF0104 family)
MCDGGEVSTTEGPATSPPTPAATEPAPRGPWRTLGWRFILGVITIVAIVVLVRRLEAVDLATRLRSAEPGWVALAVVLSVLPVVGSAVSIVALAPAELPLARTTLVQLATSFVNLVTPASAGGLALNVRYLHRRGIPLAAAVATIGIVQTTAVLVTAVLVVGLLLISDHVVHVGSVVPWPVLVAVVAVAGTIWLVLRLWTPGRVWVVANVLRPVRDTWPQLRATLASPGRLTAAVAGHLTVTLGFTGTLAAAVDAFGGSASLIQLTLVVVGSSAVAGAVPVPGGIGAAEAALLGGLVTVGVDASTALSAALLYRLVTFWARVPLGWFALLRLRRVGDV